MKISIFSVTDSVQIILKEYYSKIFDQYFHTAVLKKETGLGLNFSKKLKKAQGEKLL